ncbi:hypothetical protein I0C86_09945, partial [Plantactinospora sp. S1510]|nr:hypothetical protein [Plantactinospora alkalitolerans]
MALARSRSPVRPAVRLLPVPPLDPPFDDEYVPEIWSDRPAEPTTRPAYTSEPTTHAVDGPVPPRAVSARRAVPAVPV